MTVTTTSDSGGGGCSLRGAIVAVNNGNGNTACGPLGNGTTTITVPAGTYTLTAGELQIGASANLAIAGANANDPAQTVIHAAPASRVLEVTAGGQATLTAVEVTGGQTANGIDGRASRQGAGFGGDGGGILNHGALTLDHALVTANFTGHGGKGADGDGYGSTSRNPGSGGSGGSGGGIYNDTGATLAVAASTISANGTGDGGAGGNAAIGTHVYTDGADGGVGGPSGDGGGIYNAGGATISTTTLSGNFTGRAGAGGSGGQGASETGTLYTPSYSPAGTGGDGGAGGTASIQYNRDTGYFEYLNIGGGGGIINAVSSGTLSMTASTISGNSTGAGGNGGGGGIGGKNLNNDYRAGGNGGAAGGGGVGGGLLSVGHGASLTNVTIAGNQTGDGGTGGSGAQSGASGGGGGGHGGYGGGIWARGATTGDFLRTTHVTISRNLLGAAGPGGASSQFPGQVGVRGKGAGIAAGPRGDSCCGAGVSETNTLIAGNGVPTAGDQNCDQYYRPTQFVDFFDGGHNLSYPDTSCPGANGDPLLGPLQNNGGPTLTMLPGAGSAAIGAVPLASCTVATDQRGFPRPGGGKSACDIGALETGAAPGITATAAGVSSSANPSTAGQPVTFTATVSPAPDGGSVSFTDGGTAIPGCGSAVLSGAGQATCHVTYSVAGSHSIRAFYSGDSNFAASSSAALTEVVQSPGGGGGGGGGGGRLLTSRASNLGFSPSVFRAAGSGSSAKAPAHKPPVGTVVSFKLSRAATVRFTLSRVSAGRKVKTHGKTRCGKPTKSNRKKPRCTRYTNLRGSFSVQGAAGANRFRFTGRLNGKKLAPAKYRLTGTPITAGKAGQAAKATFRIVR